MALPFPNNNKKHNKKQKEEDHTSESLLNNTDEPQSLHFDLESGVGLSKDDGGLNPPEIPPNLSDSTNTFVQALEEGLQNLQETESKSAKRRRKHKAKHDVKPTEEPSPEPSDDLCTYTGLDDHSRTSLGGTAISKTSKSKWILTSLIVLLGMAASAAFLAFGFHATNHDEAGRFQSSAEGITYHVLSAWRTYETFGLWIHESCHKHTQPNPQIDPFEDIAGHLGYCSRREFRRLYEYVASQGVDFLSAQLLRNVTHEYREALEGEAQAYYSTHYPHVKYQGITKQVAKPEGGGFDILPQNEATPYYMPIHYVEPVQGNEVIIDLDKLATNSQDNVLQALATGRPILSQRLTLSQETNKAAYGVILAHPGVHTSMDRSDQRTNSIAQIVIRLPSFLEYALQSAAEDKSVYLYDSTDKSSPPLFLGALQVQVKTAADDPASNTTTQFTMLPEVELDAIPRESKSRYFERDLDVAGRNWTMVMVSSAHQADLLFVVLGGTIILAASLFCAAWFHSHLGRIAKLNSIKSARQAEKAQIARIQASRERDLNEFIAHEVRNPLSSAISALSFVSAGVNEHVLNPIHKKSILEDVSIMEASLAFINELLRNMLDIHRARGRQIKLNLSPVDVRRDIMEPVAAILFMRGAKVAIEVDCPPDLAVNGDRMRLKQIALNLSANSTKFVQKGYIRLRATTVDGSVELSVEDSGPGIPLEKRNRLFAKFQESLDSLNQGTGIGLAVCKNLCELMGAAISLDENFHSGVEGCPGTRFVLRLNQPPLEIEKRLEQETEKAISGPSISNGEAAAKAMLAEEGSHCHAATLPETLSVLVVDDDTMIRKMFRRAALRTAPNWEIEEACNGETALVITETRKFDVIFLDQYMASVEKQLLGTETARALRSKGVESIICGLSANDMELQFLEAGADTFMMKPFPCKKDAMAQAFMELLKIGRRRRHVVDLAASEEYDDEIGSNLNEAARTA